MGYLGGKGQSGVLAALLGQVPRCRVLMEPFAGSAAVLRAVAPAALGVAVELDPLQAERLRWEVPGWVRVVHGDGLRFLRRWPWVGDEVVFADPPYLPELRSSVWSRYRFEVDRAGHEELLAVLLGVPALVAVSTYPCDLYAERLAGWRVVELPGLVRGGRRRRELLYCNYPSPAELQDPRYVGGDYRRREVLARRFRRWRRRLMGMAEPERWALLGQLRAAVLAGGGEGGGAGLGSRIAGGGGGGGGE